MLPSMPLSSPARTRPAALVLAFGVVACGDDGGPAGTPCPDAADPCTCDTTRPECSSGSGSTSNLTATSESGVATTASSGEESGGSTDTSAPPPFSVLPPLGVLGARWVYRLELEGQEPAEQVCDVTETFTWPDGTPGSELSCTSNGGATSGETRFALHPDRVERREEPGYSNYDPAAPLYRIPLHVGDAWDVSWSFPSLGTQWSEMWLVRAAAPIELPAGTFDAIELEVVLSADGQIIDSTEWWVDGIGRVAAQDEGLRLELVSFDVP
jgi:hypothetical protein